MSDTGLRTQADTQEPDPGPDPPPAEGKRSRRKIILAAVAALVAAVLVAGGLLWQRTSSPTGYVTLPEMAGMPPSEDRARQLLGAPRSGSPWLSGSWAGGGTSTTARYEGFGSWRGAPLDAATVYPEIDSWQAIAASDWHISTFAGFDGVLSYGLPLLPEGGGGSFESIVAGEHDAVYQKIASDLVRNGRGNAIVRIGWEANGDWFPWNTTASNAAEFVAAFRHVVGVLRGTAPDLVIDFDLSCGTSLRGQQDRLDALNLLYPGDDAVDLVGCDFYDWYNTTSPDEAGWQRSIRPPSSVGIQDVAEFARAHGKGLTYPEWGVASEESEGVGDNPFFIQQVRSFFEANADILVLESYFSEPETSLANSIWDPAQMPRSADLYARLW